MSQFVTVHPVPDFGLTHLAIVYSARAHYCPSHPVLVILA